MFLQVHWQFHGSSTSKIFSPSVIFNILTCFLSKVSLFSFTSTKSLSTLQSQFLTRSCLLFLQGFYKIQKSFSLAYQFYAAPSYLKSNLSSQIPSYITKKSASNPFNVHPIPAQIMRLVSGFHGFFGLCLISDQIWKEACVELKKLQMGKRERLQFGAPFQIPSKQETIPNLILISARITYASVNHRLISQID